MGLSGQIDKNGQTAKNDRDCSTLTLNILSLCFPRKVRRTKEREENAWQAGRSEESGRAAREGDEEIREMESQKRRRKREG